MNEDINTSGWPNWLTCETLAKQTVTPQHTTAVSKSKQDNQSALRHVNNLLRAL
jgi:hypothetical protein